MGAHLGLRALGKVLPIFLDCALGRYSSDALTEWQLPVGFDAVAAARRVAAEPEVCTGGSSVDDKVSLLLERVVLPTVVVVFWRIGGGAIWIHVETHYLPVTGSPDRWNGNRDPSIPEQVECADYIQGKPGTTIGTKFSVLHCIRIPFLMRCGL